MGSESIDFQIRRESSWTFLDSGRPCVKVPVDRGCSVLSQFVVHKINFYVKGVKRTKAGKLVSRTVDARTIIFHTPLTIVA